MQQSLQFHHHYHKDYSNSVNKKTAK